MRRRLFALALITTALAMLAGLARAAGPVPETHYFFHQAGTPVAPAGDAGTFDVTAPTASTPALAPATQGLGLTPVPTWAGTVPGIVNTLKVDVWQKAPVAAGLGSADYDVVLTVGGHSYAFPTFTSPVATGAGFDEVGHTFTSTEPGSPLPIDASAGPVSIAIAGHYSDAESVTTIAYDAAAEPSGFAVNVPPPASGGIPPLQQAAGTSAFTPPVYMPGSNGYGEPSIDVAPAGTQGTGGKPQTIWITAPVSLLSSATSASPVWRSDDGGQTFAGPIQTANVGPVDTGLGGGDTDVQTDRVGNVYQDDLWLGDDSMSYSTDKGATWTGSPVSHIHPISDRAWLAYSADEDAMYMTYDGENGIMLDKALIGTAGPAATLVFQQETMVADNATRGCLCPPGSLTVDDSRAGATPYVYDAFAANDGVRVYRSDDGGLTFTHTTIPNSGTNPDHSFTTSAVDSAGNLYVTWENVVGGIADVFYAWSGDHGATWNGPFDASALLGPSRAALFPAITADDPGHVGIAFYGTPNAVDPDSAPDGTQWNVYYLESSAANSATPAFSITNIEPNFHQGQICTVGINCGSNDRSLLDFFSIQFDANHLANIIYTQGGQAAGTRLAFVEESGGAGGGATASTLSYTGDTAGTKGGTATYTALLSDANGNPISGATVSFQLGSQSAVTATTDGGGAAIATQSIGLGAGTYPLTASYAGDATHSAATATKQFVVSLASPGFGQVSLVKVGPKDGGEPSIATGPEGNLYVSYPGSKMSFYRSADQGQTWTAGGVADDQSGDTSVNVDSSGAVYQSNLNGISFNPDALQGVVYKSKDLGDHWTKGAGFLTSSNSTNQPFLVDRQWADAYIPPGKTTDQALVYFTYHDWGPNQIWVTTSTDGGATFGVPSDVILDPQAQAASLCDTIPGGIKVVQSGPHAGRVYVAWLGGSVATNAATGCNATQMNTFNTVWVAWSDDQGATWTDHLVFDGGIGHDASGLFADLTLDNAGNPYVAFADNLTGEWDMYVMASFDSGTAWNGKTDGTGVPYKVNADTGTHFFPAIAVGDPGKVDVAYIAAGKQIDTLPYGKPMPGGGSGAVWYLYMAQSLNLQSGSPSWSVERVTQQPMHLGDVCTLGIFCIDDTTGIGLVGTNRDLLDFIDLTIGKDGFAHASYTDDDLTPGIWSANQTSGSSVTSPTVTLAASNPSHGAYTTAVTVAANTTHVLAGVPVTFALGTQTASGNVNANGKATATITLNQPTGATTLKATVAGVSATAPFTIDKDATRITVVSLTKTLQAVLTAAGSNAPVAGRTVTFFVNSRKVGTAVTNSAGTATLKYSAPKNAALRSTFAGDAFFLASSSP